MSDLVGRLERVASGMLQAGLPVPPVLFAAAAALTAADEEIERLREALRYVEEQTAPLHGLAHVTGRARAALGGQP